MGCRSLCRRKAAASLLLSKRSGCARLTNGDHRGRVRQQKWNGDPGFSIRGDRQGGRSQQSRRRLIERVQSSTLRSVTFIPSTPYIYIYISKVFNYAVSSLFRLRDTLTSIANPTTRGVPGGGFRSGPIMARELGCLTRPDARARGEAEGSGESGRTDAFDEASFWFGFLAV